MKHCETSVHLCFIPVLDSLNDLILKHGSFDAMLSAYGHILRSSR